MLFCFAICQVPPVVCDRLVFLIGTTDLQSACKDGFLPSKLIEEVMPQLIALEGGWKAWPCPAMQVSDHWGLIPDQTAWLKQSLEGAPNKVWNTTGIMDKILRNGTSGLRMGSLDWFMSSQTKFINPAVRRDPIEVQQCELAPTPSLVNHFIDELFPAAQVSLIN